MVHEMVMAMVMVMVHEMDKMYEEKSIPMIALWCPSFSNYVMHEAQQLIILIMRDILRPTGAFLRLLSTRFNV